MKNLKFKRQKIALNYLRFILMFLGFFSVKAQVQNNSILFIGDKNYVYLSSNNYHFGAGLKKTKTTRTPGNYGKLVFAASSTWSGASDTHFVDGYVTTRGTTPFIFPVGQSGVYAPVQVTPTSADGVDGAYFRANPNTIGTTLDATVSSISAVEYWDIKGTLADAKIALSWRNSSAIPSLADVSIVGYDGTKWVLIPSTVDVTSFLGATSTLTEGSISSDAIVDLSLYTKFSLGAKQSSCSLTTTWNGSSWDNGTPTATTKAIISGNYSQAANITACSLEVTGIAVVTVPTGYNFTISGKVTVAPTASLTFENNANLVQIEEVANTGNITSKRNSASLMLLDYTLWSSPVSVQQLQGFSPATLPNRFYVYNPATDLYNVTTPTANFTLGKSYLIRMPNNHPTTPTIWNGSFTGVPNNGTISLSVANDTYNAIGNPYPSTMDADDFIDENNLTETLYFWRKTNGSTNTSYATYTKAGGVGTGSNLGDPLGIVPNGTIQVGQGFIAKSTSTVLTFTNAMRTANNSNQFLRTKAPERHRIWLNLSNEKGTFNQMMVAYITGGTSGIDKTIDGKYINDTATALNSNIDNEEYVIQGKGLPFEDTDIVPLAFKTNIDGNYTITIDHVDGLFLGNQNIFLKDNLTGTTHNIKQSEYSFASAKGTFNNRFQIVYKNSGTLGTDSPELNANEIIVFKQNGLLHIYAGNVIMKNVKVFDVRGRLLFEQKNTNDTSTILKGFSAEEQTIIVQITSNENKVITKKVIY